jgi:hypothetical protein
MTYTITKIGFEITGKYKKKFYTWTVGGGGTSAVIVHGIKSVKFSECTDKTGARADSAIDDTTVAGQTTLSGLTNGDTGYYVVVGK